MLPEILKQGRHPFDNTPEPQLFYANTANASIHDDLLANVLAHKGLMLLVGVPGIGKTTLLLNIKRTLEEANALVVLPRCASTSFDGLLEDCCGQLGVAENAGNRAERVQVLAKSLLQKLESGTRTVFLIDDAQKLTIEALENLSWLTDLEKGGQRLVQIVLAGQPDLVPRLCGSKLLFVQDSAIDYCELKPLEPEEIAPYVEHRLRAAGCNGQTLFPDEAMERIAQHTAGVPRLINQLCAMTLHLAVRDSGDTVSAETVEAAVQELSAGTQDRAPANGGDHKPSIDAGLDSHTDPVETESESAPAEPQLAPSGAADESGRNPSEPRLAVSAPLAPEPGQGPSTEGDTENVAGDADGAKTRDDPDGDFVVGPFPKSLMTPAADARSAWRGGIPSVAALLLVGLALGGSGMFLFMAWPWSSGTPKATQGTGADASSPTLEAPQAARKAVASPRPQPQAETAATRPENAVVPQAPRQVPSVPVLQLAEAAGSEDQPVPLDIRARPSDDDGTARLAISISGLPQGARLSAGQDIGDGSWSLSRADLSGLKLIPPRDFSGRLRLTVDVSARHTDGRSASASEFLLVEVIAAADTPGLGVADAEGRSGRAIPIDIRATLNDVDDSERLSVTISGLPEGTRLSEGYKTGDGDWRLRSTELAGLSLMPPEGFTGRLDLEVVATAREANGDKAEVNMPLTVEVTPAPPTVTAAKGDFVVQLAALRSAEDASRELSRLQSRFGKLLGDTRLKIHEAEVNGVPYFRVRTEPVPDKAETFQMCARLKSNQQDCMVLQQIAKAERSAQPSAQPAETAPAGTAPISLRPPEAAVALAQAGGPKLATEPRTGDIAVRDLVMARGIIDREPADLTTNFSTGDGRAFAHAKIYNPGEPTAVSFVWLYDDSLYATVDMQVGSSVRWRTWSSAEVWLGEWRVQIVSADGQVLAENAFTVQ